MTSGNEYALCPRRHSALDGARRPSAAALQHSSPRARTAVAVLAWATGATLASAVAAAWDLCPFIASWMALGLVVWLFAVAKTGSFEGSNQAQRGS